MYQKPCFFCNFWCLTHSSKTDFSLAMRSVLLCQHKQNEPVESISLRQAHLHIKATTDALLTEEGETPSEISAQNIAKLVSGMTPEGAKNAEDLIRVMLDKGMLKLD